MSEANIHHGDCLEVLRAMPDGSVDAIVTDPPYGLSFMGKKWDYDVPSVEIWAECLRVLKPGGHLLAFAGTRTQHRMAVRIEDAGFEIRDMIAWVYGSGFPKSLDVSKAIDKQRDENVEPVRVICRAIRAAMDQCGMKSRHLVEHFDGCHPRLIDHWAARDTDSQPHLPTWEQWQKLREVLGMDATHDAEVWRLNGRKGQPGDAWQDAKVIGEHEGATPGFGEHRFNVRDTKIRAASEKAAQWQGWGTALKPALEPITVARKPLTCTVAANVLEYGTGALNVDGCRVDASEGRPLIESKAETSLHAFGNGLNGSRCAGVTTAGRWPANLIHDGSDEPCAFLGDAARFFYCAKASKADRDEGCGALEEKRGGSLNMRTDSHSQANQMDTGPRRNHHPTVKPTDLMRYLCRLVTPPGGVVLDPFTGSGSTGKAAVLEGFRFIGIERDPQYVEIARARVAAVRREPEQAALI